MWVLKVMHGKYLNGSGILAKLREADVLLGEGMTKKEVCKKLRITSWTYDHWRSNYSGISAEAIDRIRNLKRKNNRLRRVAADDTLGNIVLGIVLFCILVFLLVRWLMNRAA